MQQVYDECNEGGGKLATALKAASPVEGHFTKSLSPKLYVANWIEFAEHAISVTFVYRAGITYCTNKVGEAISGIFGRHIPIG